ncbi:MAG: hypothetical protein M3155_03050 [Actinomycetota bacterium]|nr:hypothetical protein [Actinomycetota bacterium]
MRSLGLAVASCLAVTLGLALSVATVAAADVSDPVNQPPNDGCQRNPAGLLTFTSPEWVFVGGKASLGKSLQQVQGSASLVHTADEDLPEGHQSYDLDWDVAPDPRYAGLLAGDPAKGNGNYANDADHAKLHVEWESGVVPTYVWPTEGDRVQVWGQWIWDCGHWGQGIQTEPDHPQESLIGTGDYLLPGQVEPGAPQGLRGEQTELHPMEAVVVTRKEASQSTSGETQSDVFMSNDGTHAYAEEQCAANSGPQIPNTQTPDFSACVNNPAMQRQPIAGRSFAFFVPAPPKPSPNAVLTYRKVQQVTGDGSTEEITPRADGVEVRITFDPTADAAAHAFGASYFVGWRDQPAQSTPLRLRLESVTVNHSLDPNPNRATQSGPPPGEYNLYLNVNGVWNFIGGHGALAPPDEWAPGLGAVSDGQTFAVNRDVVFYVPAGGPVRVDVSGRECDLPRMDPCVVNGEVSDANDHPGEAIDTFPSADAALGAHTLISPVNANYAIRYRVDRAAPGTAPTSCGSSGVGSSSPNGSLAGAGQIQCVVARCDRFAPRSLFSGRQLMGRRRILLRGRASDRGCGAARGRVRRIEVAIVRRVGRRCRFLAANGRFGRVTTCRAARFLRARGTTRWLFVRRGRFRAGRYVIYVRAIDAAGNVEVAFTRRNHRPLRLR